MIIVIEILIIFILLMIMATLVLDERKHISRMKRLVKLKSYWDGINRRHVVRHNVLLEVEYSVGKKLSISRTKDISTHGIGLLLDEKLSRRTMLDIAIKVDDKIDPIKTRACVMWSQEAVEDEQRSSKRLFHTGLKFMRFANSQHEKRLFEYIKSIEKRATENYSRA